MTDKLVEKVADNIGDCGLSLSVKEAIARRVIPIISEEIKKGLEALEVWRDYGWAIESEELDDYWRKRGVK